jgi:uncharacterized hydrophobic protein (TIGR00271 family)
MKTSGAVLNAVNIIRIHIARLLQVGDEQKPVIYAKVLQGTDIASLNYWLETVFSIGIATLGLIISSPAVVIGAMLISPLMGPIIANGLALALGDFYLGIKSFICLILSILGSVLLSALITWMLPFRAPTTEILARIQPTLLDLAVAILSGAAGAVVVCRGGGGGGVTALPGVAVAVSLMPPLGVVGFGIGIGWDWSIVGGGGLLFLTNLVAIILTSFFVFFAVRMDANEVRLQINEWLETQKKEYLYDFIRRTPLQKVLGKVGSLPRRLLILVIFLAMVSFPLGRTLARLREEAQIRRTVFYALYQVIPRSAIFRENLDILPAGLRLQIMAVLPHGLPSERRAQLEEEIHSRTGRNTKINIYNVATRDEMIEITGQLGPKIEPVAPLPSIDQASSQIWVQVRPAIESAWPLKIAPLLKYRIAFESGTPRMFVYLAYLADQDLGFLGEEAIRKILQERTGSRQLELELERISPSTPILVRSRSNVPTSEGQESLKRIAAQVRRFSNINCAIVVPSTSQQAMSARYRRQAEQIQKFLIEETRIPLERIPIKSASKAGNAIVLQLQAGAGP